MQYWSVPKLWPGRTAYIIGGGPSVTQEMVDSLKGKPTIAVNMSYRNAPWASVLFYADRRWWDREYAERLKELMSFEGLIVTTDTTEHSRLLHLKRVVPTTAKNGMATAPDTISMERTSLQGAMNLCYHFGAKRIVLLGADNRDAPNGRIHHHDEYPWVRHNESWDIKSEQMGYGAAALQRLGVEVINCSPVSTLKYWPIRALADVLKEDADGQ